jgi:hypothetical protein
LLTSGVELERLTVGNGEEEVTIGDDKRGGPGISE